VRQFLAPADDTNRPVPPPDGPDTSAPAPNRAGRLLGFLRKVIGYGKELAASLQQRVSPCPEHVVTVMRNFGTVDIGLILASITRALLRASALEAAVVSRGDQPDDVPLRATPERLPRSTLRRSAQPAEPSATDADPRVVRMPTPQNIAAQIRRRPAGAVLADICFDLGIGTNHPLWPELRSVINENGGNAVALMLRIFRRERKAMEHGRTGVWADDPVPLFPAQPTIAPPAWPQPQAALAATSGADPP
jgi:hypothetical protein